MPSDTGFSGLSVGIVGAGAVAHHHILAWQSLGATVLVHARPRGREVADRYEVEFRDDLTDLLHAIDVVDVCTPTDTHSSIALAAIGAARSVMCEKPLARFPAEARQLVQAAEHAGVHLFPAHVVRYFPAYRAIADTIRSGTIGTVQSLRLSRTGASPAVAGSWFSDVRRSGGLMDLMIHDLDVARWLAGDVGTVVASQEPATRNGRLPEVVTAQVALTHRSGALSQVHGTWGAAGVPFRTTIEVWGTTGSLRHDSSSGDGVLADLGEPRGSVVLPVPMSGSDPYRAQAADFATSLTGASVPRVTAQDGVAAVELIDAALRSIDTRQLISIRRR